MGTADADLVLVRELQSGDDAALEKLMTRHQDALFRFIRGYVAVEADAIELTQETFVRAYFNIGRFKPSAKFATWLYRIALNLCRDHAKSRATRRAAITESFTPPGGDAEREFYSSTRTPAEDALVSDKMRALEEGIAQLPHDLRTALVLAAVEQRSHQECAELLDTTPKTIETRVYRARKLLLNFMARTGF